MSNAILLAELLLQYAVKAQEIAKLFRDAQGGDISDEAVNDSEVSRDMAIMRAEMKARNR